MEDLEESIDDSAPIWAIFGDLMSGLVGVFVLFLVWVLSYQFELAQSLEQEVEKRQTEEQRRMVLEELLASPIEEGRVTVHDGRIGISGNVLFSSNSDDLQPEGRELLRSLVAPLNLYLGEHQELLMVSGFTDDIPIQQGNNRFDDNWQLSSERALTVVRVLIEEGLPPSLTFAAAFGAQQPLVPNTDKLSRSQNRRVELAPVPKHNPLNSVTKDKNTRD